MATRLLRLRVRIPPGGGMFVSCECVCCQVDTSASGRSLVQRNPTECVCVPLSVIKWNSNPLVKPVRLHVVDSDFTTLEVTTADPEGPAVCVR
jgi:hypothetical protein